MHSGSGSAVVYRLFQRADWPVEIARLVHEEGERYPRLPGAQMML
jgi:hypothetical protein